LITFDALYIVVLNRSERMNIATKEGLG